ncbi:MAG: hypothetical protein LYZ69_08860 [Nitrososphaerales archaeon]|nr:hypothetical protein [Nitrososphaerales archaeon]
MSGGAANEDVRATFERLAIQVVTVLLLLAALSVYSLWTLNPVGANAEPAFALYLAVNLVSFAMVSYVYRALKRDNRFGPAPMVAGFSFIIVLLLLAFIL